MSRQMQYDKSSLENAVKAVRNKSMGYLKASKVFKVPRTTIFDKVHGKSDIYCSVGPHTVLSQEEEKRVAKWLVDMAKIGYGRTKPELLKTVSDIIKADGRPNPFKDDIPGKDWFYGFMRRHPEISLRSPRQLGKERAVITPKKVEKWFDDFEQFIKDTVQDLTILLDPTRMYNADESGFALSAKTGHVLGLRGAKSIYNVSASDRSQITVLCGMSAAAHFLRPMIVFPGQRFTRNMLEGFEEAVLGRSETGWMDSELFTSWLNTVFIPDIEERQVKKPIILFVDGHKTHMTLEASDICKENGIILYCLIEHGSHLMQPCDLRLFSSLKESWKVALRDWQIEHVGQYVTKFEFASIFRQAWLASSKVENAVNGFKDAGLFPLDRTRVLQTDKFQTCVLFDKCGSDELNESPLTSTTNKVESNAPTETKKQAEKTSVSQDEPETVKENDNQWGNQRNESGEAAQPATRETVEGTSENGSTEIPQTDRTEIVNESPMSKFLKLPEIKQSEKKRVKRELLPKAVTGEQFRAILLERKRKREEEENAKKLRKQEREKKREEKLEEKRKREEERLLKKKEREAKKVMKEEAKKKSKGKKRRRNDANLSNDSDSEDDVNLSKLADDDDSDNFEEAFETCPACNKFDQHPSRWVTCETCSTRWHFICANRAEYELLDEDERKKVEFICPLCE